ncbi:hypothetical protein [Rhodoplanes roseus]|uniref:Alkaline proteinase inhibitor/ Outer membrane lipoprotein Omp19 domain-containing protein n=1 Tax=Rhodoplanes roseus TaxID=29409 RepID=A0A327L0S1_9BRAD|nr:hypothetical protein [Rhodoplanes roseus]RAI44670.1 hypothetical protein CH341_07945 [Rhodoplanes roseus]
MKRIMTAVAVATALTATGAAAQVQGVDLNGRWQCVANCLGGPGSFAFITQYGTQLNVINDGGIPSSGWVEYPGRIWIAGAWQGAVYSPDGLTIQFDRGTVWQRPLEPPPPVRRRR